MQCYHNVYIIVLLVICIHPACMLIASVYLPKAGYVTTWLRS
jgi:hypothetical protein